VRLPDSLDLPSLRIDSLILHDVPQRIGGREGAPVLSDVPSPLDADLRKYFVARLTQTIERAASAVEYDPETSSPAPTDLVAILQNSSTLVRRSRKLATHLFNSQTGASSGGLLIIGVGKWQQDVAVIVLKIEREEALNLSRRRVEGGLTFDMEHLRNLMLGNRTRVFKAAIFGPATSPEELRGFVSDTQGGYGRETTVAHFFLSTFLGCRPSESPDVTTKRFLDVLEDFINTEIDDPVRKARYRIAAIAALQSRESRLSPRAFAVNNLDGPDEQAFLDFARERDVPLRSFSKDISRVQSRVDRMALQFANGLQISGSAESFEESVRVRQEQDGTANVNVRGKLSKVK
jgi:hypothetical protein